VVDEHHRLGPTRCAPSMKTNSVLLVTPRWTRDGGVAAHAKASAALLARHGLHVRVLAARVEAAGHVPGVTVTDSPELFNVRASLDARLAGATPDPSSVVHIHQLDDPGLVEALRASAPVVISAHAYPACPSGVYHFRPSHECTRSHGVGCIGNLMARGCAHTRHPKTLPAKYRQAGRRLDALRRADLAVAYSAAVDRHLAANGIARRKLVPLFPTIAPTAGSGHAARRRVVFAGRIAAPKGVGILIRAAREVDAEFVICGDGRQLPQMQTLARRLGVEQRICFKGWLGAKELGRELANASIVVIPSLWPEPFGLVGIEAFAAGRPVVASLTGGIPDWLEHGVSGLGVAPGDPRALARALNELIADPQRQQDMGLAGKRVVTERYSAERHVAALLEGYRAARSSWEAVQ
jgi:glycosyltransferase involved in cell wall biosynthesis